MQQNLLNYLQKLQDLPTEATIVPLTYLILAGSYLLVIPVLVLTYMKFRWYSVSSFERGFMYFLVFLFFPGLLLLSPFVNFRPRRRRIEA